MCLVLEHVKQEWTELLGEINKSTIRGKGFNPSLSVTEQLENTFTYLRIPSSTKFFRVKGKIHVHKSKKNNNSNEVFRRKWYLSESRESKMFHNTMKRSSVL